MVVHAKALVLQDWAVEVCLTFILLHCSIYILHFKIADDMHITWARLRIILLLKTNLSNIFISFWLTCVAENNSCSEASKSSPLLSQGLRLEWLSQPAGLDGLLAERLLHDFEHQVDILRSTVVAHEPHPPHLPGTGSQPTADLHLVADPNKGVTTLIHCRTLNLSAEFWIKNVNAIGIISSRGKFSKQLNLHFIHMYLKCLLW